MIRTSNRLGALTLMICLAPAGAVAQDAPPDPLAGPRVTDAPPPGVSRTMTGEHNRFNRARRLPRGAFVRALRALDDVPDASLRPDEEQSRAIRDRMDEFNRQAREFRRAHGAELRAMREARRDGGASAPSDEVQALLDQRPNEENLRSDIWAILTPDQKAFVEQQIEVEARDRRHGDGPARMEGERRRERAGSGATPPPPAPPGDDLGPAFDELRAELAQLPPEQRDRVIHAMLDRLRDRGAPGDRPARRGGRPGRGGPPPA